MLQFTIKPTGKQTLQRVSHELKAAGNGGLKKELLAGIREGAKPLKVAVKRSADLTLPHSGGLARTVARAPVSIRTRLGSNPSVRLVASSKHDIKAMNAGTVRHPLYGNRKHWYTQRVRPGWFDDPIKANEATVRKAVIAALDKVSKQIG